MREARIEISKRFTFDAAHFLPHVAEGHKCGRVHGHTYAATIVCGASVGVVALRKGMVVDYAEIAEEWKAVVYEVIDHRLLNDVSGLENPTTEVLAPWIYHRLKVGKLRDVLVRVVVEESDTTSCTYPASIIANVE